MDVISNLTSYCTNVGIEKFALNPDCFSSFFLMKNSQAHVDNSVVGLLILLMLIIVLLLVC